MKYVIVYTKAEARRNISTIIGEQQVQREKVYLLRKRGRRYERWWGQRWHRGWWIASPYSNEAELFDSVKAARRIIQTALWCRFAREDGWRASVHTVKNRPGFSYHAIRTAEVWPEAQAIDALAAVLG